jgi:hypothetical protein
MYGLSLAEMAGNVYDNDKDLARFKANFETRVRDRLQL